MLPSAISLSPRRLGSLLWVVSAAPTYLERRGVPTAPEDLRHHDRLVFTQPGYEWRFRKGGRPVSLQVPARMRANALDAVVEAAVAGAGLVYAPGMAGARPCGGGSAQRRSSRL
jgi:DNA-binding transcriptional LysR family regulator